MDDQEFCEALTGLVEMGLVEIIEDEQCEFRIGVTAFNTHLDGCEQCAEHPFELCSVGRELLESEARA